MERNNLSTVSEFILLGFPVAQHFQPLLCLFFFIAYFLTLAGNLFLIYAVKSYTHLHKPMYYLLANYSFMGICYATTTAPKMLLTFLPQHRSISVGGCITQCSFFFVMGDLENHLLVLMAYDRYLAICNPLRYPAIMTGSFCGMLMAGCWVASFLESMLPIIWISLLPYCAPKEFNHFFCDMSPLLKHSCTDTTLLKQYFFIVVWIVILSCFILISVSYSIIIWTIMKMSSTIGRQKAFSTCTSHIIVVVLYYGSVICVYARQMSTASREIDIVVSVVYVVIAPLCSPFIYSLRNTEVRNALRNVFGKCCKTI